MSSRAVNDINSRLETVPDAGANQDQPDEVNRKIHLLMERFPRGLNLSSDDLAIIAWLYIYDQETGSRGISDSQIKWLIPEAGKHLALDYLDHSPTHIIQRLMRFGILRAAITDTVRSGYRLTCLGQGLARNLMDEIDYSSEQLNVLLSCALAEVKSATQEGPVSLLKYLQHVFLGTIREKIEQKLLSMDEDLQERKSEVKRTYSGSDEEDFENSINDIEYCRLALSELVDAVQESSACVELEELLHDWIDRKPDSVLYEILEQSLDFLYVLRGRVDAMLKNVVQFIRDCVAYRSLALTLDARDRLCRTQERILSFALGNDIRMPIIDTPRLPRMDLNWSRQERSRPVVLDMNRITSLENFLPPDLPSLDPEWKDHFLETARNEWELLARRGGIDLGEWLGDLALNVPQIEGSPCIALYLLTQDWPRWNPGVSLTRSRGKWIPLGKEWLMEAIALVPTNDGPLQHGS